MARHATESFVTGLADWYPFSLAVTRTDDRSFNVAGAYDTVLRKGARVRWKDGADFKYGVIGYSQFSTPNTSVTLIETTDYLMTANPTEFAVSYSDIPPGFPGFFRYTPTVQGFSTLPSTTFYQWTTTGTYITLYVRQGQAGVSNSTSFQISTPINAATEAGNQWQVATAFVDDNGATQATPGRVYLASGGNNMVIGKTSNSDTWTASGNKRANFTLSYRF